MIDDDIRNIINKRPISITNFLRTAKNLTNDDWNIFTKQVLNMNSKVS